MKYKSKIGWEILAPLIASLSVCTILELVFQAWLGLLIVLLTALFSWYLFANTYYIIEDNILRIRAGFLVDKKIDIHTIQSVEDTNSVLSSPALSIKGRIRISYLDRKEIIVSPKEKAIFLQQLQTINPNILFQVKY